MLKHGGRLVELAKQYGIAQENWLDLSTGINPQAWPVPEVPARCWQRLPEVDDGLEAAAAAYYGADNLLPVAGSQAAIQSLPRLYTQQKGRSAVVGVLAPAYAEHAHCWRNAGHEVREIASQEIVRQLPELDVLVVVNPNNPSGECFSRQQLLGWQSQLASRGGWLVVDEAFMDVTPEQSLVTDSQKNGLIILRSLGKFFGLAGVRVGFVFAQQGLLQSLEETLGPWSLSHPGRWVAKQALQDGRWQQRARQELGDAGERLATILRRCGFDISGGCALFQWCRHDQALWWHAQLAQQGIAVRLFEKPAALRFGLPGEESEWQRLQEVLVRLQESLDAA